MDKEKNKKHCEIKNEDKTLMMIIGDAHRLFGHSIHDLISRKGISNTVNSILFHLERNESLTQIELVERAHVKPPTVSVALQKMEEEELIERFTSLEDQRYVMVKITDKGRNLCNEMKEYIHAMDLSLTENISEEELIITRRVLIQIIDKMLEGKKK